MTKRLLKYPDELVSQATAQEVGSIWARVAGPSYSFKVALVSERDSDEVVALRLVDPDGSTEDELTPFFIWLASLMDADTICLYFTLRGAERIGIEKQARDLGYQQGRRDIVRVAHELLGVDRLVRAIDGLGPV